MAAPIIPQHAFSPRAQARAMERTTLIEDAPQESIRRASHLKLQSRPGVVSPLSDSFPTPKANRMFAVEEAFSASCGSSDTESEQSSIFSKRSPHSDFDEMYDLTESESEGDVPIKLSRSVKKRQEASRQHKFPPLVIPSPREWPTIEKLKSAVTPLSPPLKIDIAPSVLAAIQSSDTPTSSAPSLDDDDFSVDSRSERESPSCPSTPDIEHVDDGDNSWEIPIRLDPSTISMLEHINGEDPPAQVDTVIELPEEAVSEMREVLELPSLTARMRLDTQNIPPSTNPEDELSELSVPSPSNFFASLNSSVARNTWCAGPKAAPTTSVATEFYDCPFKSPVCPKDLPTSTATKFYDVPWLQRPENPVEHTIEVDTRDLAKPEPVTARRVGFSPIEEVIEEVDELDETYENAIQQSAVENLDRTALWLSAQTDYMKAICEDESDADVLDSFQDLQDAVPKTPDRPSPALNDNSPSGKKSVRFADEESSTSPEPKVKVEKKRISPIHDGTFWEGWRVAKRSQRARDVFQHRQLRAEAEHVKRISCDTQHVTQLQGKYEIVYTERPAPERPISKLMPNTTTDDDKTKVIQLAERERQALLQMQSSSWHLSAHQEIIGGKLLTSPIVASFKDRQDVRILDLAGQAHCSWAWDVALEHPSAFVYTTVSTDAEAHVAESTLDGPANHSVVAAPKLWELPFEDNYFDVISARNLYAHLRTNLPKGEAADEWDLTLRECLRCLKPSGYLEFDLLDAELAHPEGAGQALGVEFAFNLKTRGYDPSSGKTFLPRLKRAGFQSIKRAWIVLPFADVVPRWTDTGKAPPNLSEGAEKRIGPNGEIECFEPPITGSTKDVRALTGLIGGRMWEQWMLKLNSEMGRSEARCLDGVAKALEEGGKGNAGWRCLVGWAKKGAV